MANTREKTAGDLIAESLDRNCCPRAKYTEKLRLDLLIECDDCSEHPLEDEEGMAFEFWGERGGRNWRVELIGRVGDEL